MVQFDGGVASLVPPGLEKAIHNRDGWWWSSAMLALEWLAQQGEPFDAYDLTELGVMDPDHPNRWGALFRAAHTAGAIIPVGFRESRRPSRAGGVCRVWRGVEPAP